MSDSQGQHRQWHFDWRLLVFSGVFLPILIGLGVWQLNRAEEKQLLLNQWQQEAENRARQHAHNSSVDISAPSEESDSPIIRILLVINPSSGLLYLSVGRTWDHAT